MQHTEEDYFHKIRTTITPKKGLCRRRRNNAKYTFVRDWEKGKSADGVGRLIEDELNGKGSVQIVPRSTSLSIADIYWWPEKLILSSQRRVCNPHRANKMDNSRKDIACTLDERTTTNELLIPGNACKVRLTPYVSPAGENTCVG
jgi:hypothetical protein